VPATLCNCEGAFGANAAFDYRHMNDVPFLEAARLLIHLGQILPDNEGVAAGGDRLTSAAKGSVYTLDFSEGACSSNVRSFSRDSSFAIICTNAFVNQMWRCHHWETYVMIRASLSLELV
jgi:hypothetical protein